MPVPPRTARRPVGHPLLWAGFGSLILLMPVAGGYALTTLAQVRAGDLEERDIHLRRDQVLEQVRSGIYQSAIVMRDYLFASGDKTIDTKTAAAQIERFAETRDRTMNETFGHLRLEQELEQRYREGSNTQQELEELSARLVPVQEEERRSKRTLLLGPSMLDDFGLVPALEWRAASVRVVGMEERAFHVQSTPGQGTKADVELPLAS